MRWTNTKIQNKTGIFPHDTHRWSPNIPKQDPFAQTQATLWIWGTITQNTAKHIKSQESVDSQWFYKGLGAFAVYLANHWSNSAKITHVAYLLAKY